MAYKYILIILILGVAMFSGCITEDKTVYFSKTANETITLYKDNTFYLKSPDKESGNTGAYRIDNDRVILTFAPMGNKAR